MKIYLAGVTYGIENLDEKKRDEFDSLLEFRLFSYYYIISWKCDRDCFDRIIKGKHQGDNSGKRQTRG